MSECKTIKNDRGVVLVVALLVLAVLSLMVFALAYNLTSYLKITATVREKSQAYYTSSYGLEQLRTWLGNKHTVNGIVNKNCYHNDQQNTWCGLIPTNDAYKDVTSTIASSATPSFAKIYYKIYFKNNEEGDAELVGADNDQIVMASIEATSSDQTTKSVVEAMLINTYSAKDPQAGGNTAKTNTTGELGAAADPDNSRVIRDL